MRIITKFLINVVSLLVVGYLVPGFEIKDFKTAVIAALVIGIINTFIKPLLKIITFPITVLTLGIFSVILNVLLLMLAASITPGFHIDGFFTALIASIILSLISSLLNALTK